MIKKLKRKQTLNHILRYVHCVNFSISYISTLVLISIIFSVSPLFDLLPFNFNFHLAHSSSWILLQYGSIYSCHQNYPKFSKSTMTLPLRSPDVRSSLAHCQPYIYIVKALKLFIMCFCFWINGDYHSLSEYFLLHIDVSNPRPSTRCFLYPIRCSVHSWYLLTLRLTLKTVFLY